MPTVGSITSAWRARLVEHELPAALNKSLAALARDVADAAPVETGRLRRSVHAVPAHAEGSAIRAAVVVADQKGHLIEFGTVQQHPRPYFRPAARAAGPKIRAALLAAGRR